MDTKCHSPVDGRLLSESADVWLISPEGKPLSAMCLAHALVCIKEYEEKLGEKWSFRPIEGAEKLVSWRPR